MPEAAASNQNPDIQPMTDAELVAFCKEEIGKSIGGNAGADSDVDVTTPLDYYLGRRPGLTPTRARDANASRYVSMDVMDGVESTVEEIMPVFSTGDIGYFEPLDEEDEDQAASETDIVNYLFMEEYDGFTLLQTALKDALLHRNCSAKCYWDERLEVEFEVFDNVPAVALPKILEPESKDQKVEIVEQIIDEEGNAEAQKAIQGIQSQGGPQTPTDQAALQQLSIAAQDKYSITVKRTTKVGRPVIECMPPEQTKVKAGHSSLYLHECGFVAHEMLKTQSELIEEGIDPNLVNQLADYASDINEKSRSRNAEERDYTASHRSVRPIKVFECYCLVDFDGDGIAERRKVLISDCNHLLDNKPFSSVAIVGGAVRIMPHKYKGISMFERLRDIQDAKTPVARSIIDGTQISANPRIGVITGKANIDDVLTSRTGGIVRAERSDALFEIPKGEVPQSAFGFMEFMDGVRRDRGGGSIDMSDQVHAVRGNSGDMGLERIMSSMELGSALIANNLGETFVRGIFLEMHNILRQNYPRGEKISAKIGGKWVSTVPSDWKKRTKVTIQVGASLAERARQSMALTEIVQEQEKLMQVGSVMYDEARHYQAMADRAKLRGIRSPEKYFVDPDTPEGKQKGQFKKQMMQQVKAKEEKVKQIMVEAQAALGKAETMKAKADNDANVVRYQNEQLKTQVDTLKTELKALTDSGQLQFKYAELAEKTAIALTELEMKFREEVSARNEANKPTNGSGNGAVS
jgi:hypothetical protein